MKSNKWNKFKKGYASLILMSISCTIVGLVMIISPEKTSDFIIRGVGLLFTLSGISYGMNVLDKYLKKNM